MTMGKFSFLALQAASPECAEIAAAVARSLLAGHALEVPAPKPAPEPWTAAGDAAALVAEIRDEIPAVQLLARLEMQDSRAVKPCPQADAVMRDVVARLMFAIALRANLRRAAPEFS